VTSGEKYVAAVYGVVFLFVLVYVLIIATKLGRLQREVGELARLVRARKEREAETPAPEQEEVAVG
jgi:CcmD family protein